VANRIAEAAAQQIVVSTAGSDQCNFDAPRMAASVRLGPTGAEAL